MAKAPRPITLIVQFLRKLIFSAMGLSFASLSPSALASNSCSRLFLDQDLNSYQNVASTTQVLSQLTKASGKKMRSNPTLIDIGNLKINQELYVSPIALGGYRNISEPILMKIVNIVPDSTHNGWDLFYLENPQTGILEIESSKLYKNIYSVRDYVQHSPFVEGEYVQIGSETQKETTFQRLGSDTPLTLTGYNGTSTFIGKFLRAYDEKNYLVQIKIESDVINIPPTDLIVPHHLTYGLASGTPRHFQNSIRSLLTTPIQFATHEPVRFRDSSGLIQLGTFIKSNGRYITVQDNNGRRIYVSPQSVFRYYGGDPYTAVYNAEWIKARFQNPSYLVRQFLDGAGKLTSLSDFSTLTPENKIIVLTKYLRSHVSVAKGASLAEYAGLNNFNEILSAGAGVCRHLSVLMSAMLSELGYKYRLTYYDGDGIGHAWLEVDIKTSDDKIKTFVLDPTYNGYLKSYDEVLEKAAKDKQSNEANWYTNPQRKYFVQPAQ